MTEKPENENNNGEQRKTANASDHLANERTFLAWIRTSIGIMAFGFVVVKFSLFIKQISVMLDKQIVVHQYGYSSLTGILLVCAGAFTALFSYTRYMHTKKQLETNSYQSSSALIIALTAFIVIISISLIVYLVRSV